jgi:hypothetical protein
MGDLWRQGMGRLSTFSRISAPPIFLSWEQPSSGHPASIRQASGRLLPSVDKIDLFLSFLPASRSVKAPRCSEVQPRQNWIRVNHQSSTTPSTLSLQAFEIRIHLLHRSQFTCRIWTSLYPHRGALLDLFSCSSRSGCYL